MGISRLAPVLWALRMCLVAFSTSISEVMHNSAVKSREIEKSLPFSIILRF